MNRGTLDRTALLSLALLIGPSLLVVGARLARSITGPTLAQAALTGAPADASATSDLLRRSSPVQLEAAARIAALQNRPADPTPLFYPEAPAPTPPPIRAPAPALPAPSPAAPEPERPLGQVSVTSIFRAADGQNIAVINGKLRRVGEELAPGWKVTTIDPAGRLVTVTGETGESVDVPFRHGR